MRGLLYLCAALTAVSSIDLSLLPGSVPAEASVGSLHADAPAVRTNVAVFGTQTAGPTRPDGRGIFEFGATPGGQLQDHVAVINYSTKPLPLLIRGTDAVNTPQGGFALLPPDEQSRQVGTWIAVPPQDLSIVVPARSDVIIPFAVSVPRNATPGDHAGGITATLESFITSKSGQRIRLLQSVGTRVFVRVSGPLHPLLAVTGLSVKYDDPVSPISSGTATITYTVSNVGNVALGGRPVASVSGLLGSKKTVTKLPEIQLLLPGFSVKETAKVTGVYPEVHESAHVSVTRLIIPGSVQPASGPFTASTSFWAVPWILLVVVILIIAGGIWWFSRKRRRKDPSDSRGLRDAPGGTEVSKTEAPAGSDGFPVAADMVVLTDSKAGARHRQGEPVSLAGADGSEEIKK
jgi:hypothetical protein